MANTCELRTDGHSASLEVGVGGDIKVGYRLKLDSSTVNPEEILSTSRVVGPDSVPLPWDRYSVLSGVYALHFAISQVVDDDIGQFQWNIDVTYKTPDLDGNSGGNNPGKSIDSNPLLRKAYPDLRFYERSEVIKQARNVEELANGLGKGGTRAANTLGPITNAAGVPPDVAETRTKRTPVLVFNKNFPDLDSILAFNDLYKTTTNSDTVGIYTPRTCEFLVSESLGFKEENGIGHYPVRTLVAIGKSTDIIHDNVGFDEWDAGIDKLIPITYAGGEYKGQRVSEPRHLNLAGAQVDALTPITYRDHDEVAYLSADPGKTWVFE